MPDSATLIEEIEAAPTPRLTSHQIRQQIQNLMESHHFRNSKRHRRLIEFLVEKHLQGEDSGIKERTIGVEVFGRKPGYDVASDPIVRGAAADLRKRLALYYNDPAHSDELRLEIPIGTYVPIFHRPHIAEPVAAPMPQTIPVHAVPQPQVGAQPATGRPWRMVTVLFSLGVIAVLVWMFVYLSPSRTRARNLDRFWAPLLESQDVLICAGDLNFIMIQPIVPNDSYGHQTLTRNHLDANVGLALIDLSALLGARGKHIGFRLADGVTLTDLRAQPVVLVGGFNNPWAQRLLEDKRFQLRIVTAGVSTIVDHANDDKVIGEFQSGLPLSNITRSFSLITRAYDPLLGQNVISIAGLGSIGNSSAAEFVTNPRYLGSFLKDLPRQWEGKTMQIVIETTVVEGKASPPRVIASQME